MHCNQCGLDLPDNYKFCPKCGIEITLEGKSMANNKDRFVKNESNHHEKPKKKLSTKKAVAIGILVFFAFVIISGQIMASFDIGHPQANHQPLTLPSIK